MIDRVTLHETTYAPPPSRFEAGTPAIAEAIGFGAAVDYLTGIGMARLQQREAELGGYLYQQVCKRACVCMCSALSFSCFHEARSGR